MVAKNLEPLAAEDALLNRRVMNFLHNREVPAAQGLAVESHFGTLVISGKLASKRDKWLCLECCRRVAGVVKLIDHVRVQPTDHSVQGGPRLVSEDRRVRTSTPMRRRAA